jgi:hypothetical protein
MQWQSFMRKSLEKTEVSKEATDNISLFWELWNSTLEDYVQQTDYVFNPFGWYVDENGDIWCAICDVYGAEAVQ